MSAITPAAAGSGSTYLTHYPRVVLKVIAALVPSAGILFLFWLALKSLVEADRRERAAEAKLNRAKRDADRAGSAGASGAERSAGGDDVLG